MKKLLLTISVAILCGCNDGKLPQKTETSSNNHYEVHELFMYDSIKVYSFEDNYRTHYFTKDMTISIKRCGKHCTYEETIKQAK